MAATKRASKRPTAKNAKKKSAASGRSSRYDTVKVPLRDGRRSGETGSVRLASLDDERMARVRALLAEVEQLSLQSEPLRESSRRSLNRARRHLSTLD